MKRPADAALMTELARIGARHRLEELRQEMRAIEALLGDTAGAAKTTSQRRRKGMSAAQKRAVSARMKQYWAKRRAAGKK